MFQLNGHQMMDEPMEEDSYTHCVSISFSLGPHEAFLTPILVTRVYMQVIESIVSKHSSEFKCDRENCSSHNDVKRPFCYSCKPCRLCNDVSWKGNQMCVILDLCVRS